MLNCLTDFDKKTGSGVNTAPRFFLCIILANIETCFTDGCPLNYAMFII